jgi:predicted glutamine amidotransferase
MCIAILNSPNVTFPKSLIKNCWDNNRDGGGMIWSDDSINQLHIFKEVKSFETFYNKYVEIRKGFPNSNVVLHFRISTSGGVNETNCHPFQVNKDIAFVHNGIISELNGIDAKRSDTNLFNEMYLRKLPSDFLYNEAIIMLIKKFIGSSKLIFLNAYNEYTIVNENLGQRDDEYEGCWFSNATYKKVNYVDYGGKKVYSNAKPIKQTIVHYPKVEPKADDHIPLFLDYSDEVYDEWQERYDELKSKDVASLTDSEWEEMENLKWYCI